MGGLQGGGWRGGSDGQRREREYTLVKHNITRDVDTVGWNMKTLVPFVKRAIPKKYTKFGPKLELALIIRTKMRPACTTKNFEKSIIWNLIKQ